jgi:hypothetical protein
LHFEFTGYPKPTKGLSRVNRDGYFSLFNGKCGCTKTQAGKIPKGIVHIHPKPRVETGQAARQIGRWAKTLIFKSGYWGIV